jgi:hypothetical protein
MTGRRTADPGSGIWHGSPDLDVSKGYDLDYPWRQVGRSAGKSAAEYYIQASEGGGEPPGRWWGPGARVLGFAEGQVVDREP